MTRKYNLAKKSDMRRLTKDLEKEAIKIATKSIKQTGIDYECPHCGQIIRVFPGSNVCEYCSNSIEVDFA